MRAAWPLLLAAVTLAACRGGEGPPGRLTDPDAIAARIAERATEDFQGVRDFTVSGDGLVIYFRRTGPDSLVAFEYRAFTDDSVRRPVASPYVPPNTMQIARGLRGNARLAGVQNEADGPAYVLDVDDPARLIGSAADAAPDTVRLLVDAETFRVLELRLTVPQASLNPAADSAARPVIQRQRYADFRTQHGLTIPFRSAYLLEGVFIPEQERTLQGGLLEFRRRQAAGLPPAERAQALREIEREMRFLETGVLEQTFAVEAVEVNTGVPEEAFRPRGGP